MDIHTKHLGNISYTKEDIIHFPNGIFGFEMETQFLLIPFSKSEESFYHLQSILDSTLSFVIINPTLITKNYTPNISRSDLLDIGVPENKDLAYFSICVIRESLHHSTINLRCPILINLHTKVAKQVILEEKEYNFRHPIISQEKEE